MSQDGETIDLDGELSVKAVGDIENWLFVLVRNVQTALRKIFNRYNGEISNQKKNMDKETLSNIINKNLGQILITMA